MAAVMGTYLITLNERVLLIHFCLIFRYANDLKQAQETKPKSNVDKQRKGYKENRTSKSIPPTIELQENDIPFSDKRQPRLKRVFRRYFMCCFRY